MQQKNGSESLTYILNSVLKPERSSKNGTPIHSAIILWNWHSLQGKGYPGMLLPRLFPFYIIYISRPHGPVKTAHKAAALG